MTSSNPRIWAAGDVTGHREFVYVADSGNNRLQRFDLFLKLSTWSWKLAEELCSIRKP
mgnify:CR=1 FL=1